MDVTTKLTDAYWLSARRADGQGPGHAGKGSSNETAYFRCVFALSEPASLALSVSAHSRYRLWINGEPVGSGPCKGDRWRHYYETIDVSSYLTVGVNVIAAKVVAYGPYESLRQGFGGPVSVMANAAGPCWIAGGQCLSADGTVLADVTTGAAEDGWLVCIDEAIDWEAYSPAYFVGAMERVDGTKLPRGWNCTGQPGGTWEVPVRRWKADGRPYGIIPPFPLLERPIPLLFEQERNLVREIVPTRQPGEATISFGADGMPRNPVVIPADSLKTVILDAGELTTGYVRLRVEQGQGSRVTLLYAESFSTKRERGFPIKGKRDDADRFDLIGHEDVYRPSGGQDVYEPFWFRTFRFVKITVETGDEPLLLYPLEYRVTGYPLAVSSAVESTASWIRPLWDVSVRTLQRCMHETYEDCPYYEQLQYTMDTRLQILFTYAISGDTRLALRAIDDYHASLLPEGILQARYPCMESQVIPTFSLHWIFMLEDYYWQTGDPSIIRKYRATIDSVLEWFDRKIGGFGLVERLGYWEFIDWVPEWDELNGAPEATLHGPSTIHNLVYAYALQTAARLSALTQRHETAAEYGRRAADVLAAVRAHCWSEPAGLYREGPEFEQISQHAQVWAVLTGLAAGEEARLLMQRMLERDDLLRCSYAMSFYLFRALEKVGLYAETERLWQDWRNLLALNLTTWPEDPFMQRSDCHGWGALPLFEFTRCLLGVQAAAPGWEAIRIKPNILSMEHMSGQAITPKGPVKVEWKRTEEGLAVAGESPAGTPLCVVLPDGMEHHLPHGGRFELICETGCNQANEPNFTRWKVGTSFSVANPIDLHEVKRAGLDCIELTWQPLDIFDPEVKWKCDQVVAAARKMGLEVTSLHIPFGTEWDPSSADPAGCEQVINKVRQVFSYAREWGIRTAVFHPSWEPILPEERAQRLETARQTLGQLSRDAASYGIRLAAECLPRTCLGHSASEMEYLTAGNPELGICCDVNHLFKEKPQHFIERLGDRIVTTHISDNDGMDEKHWLPGEGIIEWREVLAAFAGKGYRGVMMHEIRKPDPFAIKDRWQRLIGGLQT